ncbi:MAG: response regulator [Sandaracinaceae bacterium]
MKVLVVDDSKAMRMIVKRSLRQAEMADLDVIEAENGKQAYDLLLGPERYELVLCDWNMPEMSGIELLRKLNEENIRVRFGFVTSESTEEMRAQAREAGAVFLLSKPFTPEMLKEKLTLANAA